MKKILILAFMALAMATAHAITVDDVFNAFPDADNVEKVNLDKDMLKMMDGKMPGNVKDINALRVVNIKAPTAQQFSVARKFLDAEIDGMDLILDVNEHGEVSIYASTSGDFATKLLIVVVNDRDNDSEAVVVYIDGKINIGDIGNLVKLGN